MPEAVRRRLGFALAASAVLHVALLASAPFAPGERLLSLWRDTASGPGSLTARLVPQPVSEPAEAPPPSRDVPAPASQQVPTVEAAADRGEPSGLRTPEVFYSPSELEERAEALNVARLAYPEDALKAEIRGKVVVRLWIDRRGRLADAAVISADPPGVFDAAALEAVRTLEFRPAKRQGLPVGSIKTIEVPFHPNCSDNGNCLD